MHFASLDLIESITIKKLYSFHYFEYAKGYVFDGEQHDFWEFLYVDKGEVEVRADDRTLQLSQGEIIFHKPGEFHTVRVGHHHKPPNLIVISFECKSPEMGLLENKTTSLGKSERELLALILREGFLSFTPPFDDPSIHDLPPRPDAPFAGKQVLKSYLEILLIRLLRNELQASAPEAKKMTSIQKDKAEEGMAEQVIAYMKNHLSKNLTLDEICQAVHIGKTRLKEIFHSRLGAGAMDYFKQLKMDEAKTLIREKQYNFSEIAAILGFGSIHYFSRDFKKSTGMSPSEYARSVLARAEGRG